MTAQKVQSRGWPVKAADAPRLSATEWGLTAISGIVLLVMAILQLISFSDFKDGLQLMDLPAPTVWGICIVIAELWGAAGFFKLRLSVGFRYVSYTMAILASGFWFVNNLQLVSTGKGEQLQNSYFFGRFLVQTPGWWTAVEVSILLFWVVYKVGLLNDKQVARAR